MFPRKKTNIIIDLSPTAILALQIQSKNEEM